MQGCRTFQGVPGGWRLEKGRGASPESRVRIIGGHAGRRRLDAPKGLAVRPTPDLVRQAIFNSLGPVIEGAVVLDLFSGSGALGLECLSRGAERVVSVELSPRHAACIRDNVRRLGLAVERHEVRVQDAFAAVKQLAAQGRSFDFIFADPPYGPKTKAGTSKSLSQKLVEAPGLPALLASGGRLVLGHARRDGVTVPGAWTELRQLVHGDSVFRLLTPAGVASGAPAETEAGSEGTGGAA